MTSRYENSNNLYERALRRIPLASQTFSKSALNTVNGAAPLFLDYGKGPYVWDCDGNRYVDFIIGLMPLILGYCDPDVDRSITSQINKGILFSLPTELEIELSELLADKIPSAEMVRFGKNGSDVTSAAVRLARHHTGRERIAACGYHGWHDWYIGTTTRDSGVPNQVKALTATFPFNDSDAFEALLRSDPNGFAAVILEPAGVEEPDSEFLTTVRDVSDKYGVVLIFDEIITGFRVALGGAQEKYGVMPDLSVFGKALGNGMPISAIVGRKEVMIGMEEIFFSGTFSGETLSLAAGVTTVKKLEKINAPEIFREINRKLRDRITENIVDSGLEQVLSMSGPDWWPRLTFHSCKTADRRLVTSLFRQELMARGVLMGAAFNFCVNHIADDVIAEVVSAFSESMRTLVGYLDSEDPETYLRGKQIKPIFQVRG